MPTNDSVLIREATPDDDAVIAEHFYKLWQDNSVPNSQIQPDWLEITLQFIDRARQDLHYKAFIAESDRLIVGSAGCHLFAGLYPLVLTEQYRKYGYIWGVYVEPSFRRQGIAKQLTNQTVAHLAAIGCTRAILHASPSGKPVYTSLGFCDSNEMRLDL